MQVNEEKSTIVINIGYLDIIITQHNINEAKAHIFTYKSELDKVYEKNWCLL